eukprot:NODE_3297_length_1245_cov_122.163993_g3131_i0.p1 GENE.NODE_3297_length_1245_cov_122.163993_g3131_i0~~NODE_3297_length_1245_cov_122.163993_g3131_i0.p1  ORF type:complete len:375 (-),score=63.50 NODE_3297_length_1245_cov_122.163993_g3131_i0:121-1185(-)
MATMKALVLTEYNKFEYLDWPRPDVGPNDVLIKVHACGICGSDVHGMDGSSGRRLPPLIMGHEASGEIVDVGSKVTGWSDGDRVTFDSTVYLLDDWYTKKGLYNLSDNREVVGVAPLHFKRHGAYAEYVAVPSHILYKIPDEVSYEQAAMVEPISVALHAASLTPIAVDDAAVVVGAGMIGLCMIGVLKVAGCGRIIALDISDAKLNAAKEMGATHVLRSDDPNLKTTILDLTCGRGADIAFEAVGVEVTALAAIASVRKGGCVTMIGNVTPMINFPIQDVVTRQIRIQGSCSLCGEYDAALHMIQQGKFPVEKLLSAVAPLKDGAKWFHTLKHEPQRGLLKVLLCPQMESESA